MATTQAMPSTGSILVNLFDGSRQPWPAGVEWNARISDGQSLNARKSYPFNAQTGSSELIKGLPYFDNLFDDYTVVVQSNGYNDTGWHPVRLTSAGPARVDLMLVPKAARIVFGSDQWTQLTQTRSYILAMLGNGAASGDLTKSRVFKLLEDRPDSLAALLNLAAAMDDMKLPSGNSPLDYHWQLGWPAGDPATTPGWTASADGSFKQDRIFAYVDEALLPDVREANRQGSFAPENNPSSFHGSDATESYKQTQFDVANVQLTFHGHDTCVLNGIKCVKVEPDIDYYKDLLTHGLLEVLPNLITGGKTDPKVAYMLRWMAGRTIGRNFNPVYTLGA